MRKKSKVALMLSVPREIRDLLRTMAAERNLKDPAQVTSAASIAAEIIFKELKGNESTETGGTKP